MQGGCGLSLLRGSEKLTGHGPAVGGPSSPGGFGPYELPQPFRDSVTSRRELRLQLRRTQVASTRDCSIDCNFIMGQVIKYTVAGKGRET